MTKRHIPSYQSFINDNMLSKLLSEAEPHPDIRGLKLQKGLRQAYPRIEDKKALSFVCDLYKSTYPELAKILALRKEDAEYCDAFTQKAALENQGQDIFSRSYKTIIGSTDDDGQMRIGFSKDQANAKKVAPIPPYLAGPHITLFGPAENTKMCLHAMNSWHRVNPNEGPVLQALLKDSSLAPKWGADNEDSKTPSGLALARATENLLGCFAGSLSLPDSQMALAKDHLAQVIKRPQGLALPDPFHFYQDNPLPLHLYDLGMHLFHCWDKPEALCFYFPKLESEKEAAYLAFLLRTAEEKIQVLHPSYKLGTIRIMIVFEHPRAIFRVREIASALYPYFVGGSLGWHDYLAATAKLFKYDPHYQIPVKADPEIVIHHIKEAHELLAREIGAIGGIALGGMYGVLPELGNPLSEQLSMVGFIKDVVTQLKRNLQGFWLAHPDFVRPAIGLVLAWQKRDAKPELLSGLIHELVKDPKHAKALCLFIEADDVSGLDKGDPLYERALVASCLRGKKLIANNDPEEMRYNIFQTLQYLVDWLSGNGCVALPATLRDSEGNTAFVKIMDDLATTERSRWELWAEVFHDRFSSQDFEKLLDEEIEFIQNDKDQAHKKIQVRFSPATAKWYPVAKQILRLLVLQKKPRDFVSELLLPFTFDFIRQEQDPWLAAQKWDAKKYEEIELFI